MAASPEQLHTEFQDAFNRHDLDAIVALYEPDAILARPDGTVQGADAIREAYRRTFAVHPAITVKTLSVHRTGDVAMLHGKWSLRATGIHTEGRNTETVRLQSDGRWLFAIDNPSVPQD